MTNWTSNFRQGLGCFIFLFVGWGATAAATGKPGGSVELPADEPTRPPYAVIEVTLTADAYGTSAFIPNRHGEFTATLIEEWPITEPIWIDAYGRRSAMQCLPLDEYCSAEFRNDRGEMVGEGHPFEYPGRIRFWTSDGTVYPVPAQSDPALKFYFATGLNNHGQISGWASTTGDPVGFRAFRWDLESGIQLLPSLDPSQEWDSSAHGINDAGTIVGRMAEVANVTPWIPVVWEADFSVRRLPTPLDPAVAEAWVWGINNDGVVCGSAQWEVDGLHEPTLWLPDGDMLRLPLPDEHRTDLTVRRIADNGYVFGHLTTVDQPVVWSEWDADPVAVLKLFPPSSGWDQIHVVGGNVHGQFSGNGERGYNRRTRRGFTATPVHYSMSLSKVVPGRVGEENAMRISAAPANTRVYVVAGTMTGGAYLPGCSILQNALQIHNPRLAAEAVTDEFGRAVVTGYILDNYIGERLAFQAFTRETCEISNLVVQDF